MPESDNPHDLMFDEASFFYGFNDARQDRVGDVHLFLDAYHMAGGDWRPLCGRRQHYTTASRFESPRCLRCVQIARARYLKGGGK